MISFGDIGPRVRPAEQRTKTEEDHARRKALPAECAAWEPRLSLESLETMAAVVRAYRSAGEAPCQLARADIASELGITADGAERRLARLIEIGAVERIERLDAPPLFRPHSPGSARLVLAQRAVSRKQPAPARKAIAAPLKTDLFSGSLGLRHGREIAGG